MTDNDLRENIQYFNNVESLVHTASEKAEVLIVLSWKIFMESCKTKEKSLDFVDFAEKSDVQCKFHNYFQNQCQKTRAHGSIDHFPEAISLLTSELHFEEQQTDSQLFVKCKTFLRSNDALIAPHTTSA